MLELVDTAGQEDYDRLRPLSYNKADIFLVCYSVVVPSSYTNVKETWIPELKQHAADVPFLLVRCRWLDNDLAEKIFQR